MNGIFVILFLNINNKWFFYKKIFIDILFVSKLLVSFSLIRNFEKYNIGGKVLKISVKRVCYIER